MFSYLPRGVLIGLLLRGNTYLVVKHAFLCCVLWYKDSSCIQACIVNVLLCFSYTMQNGLIGHRIASLPYNMELPHPETFYYAPRSGSAVGLGLLSCLLSIHSLLGTC